MLKTAVSLINGNITILNSSILDTKNNNLCTIYDLLQFYIYGNRKKCLMNVQFNTDFLVQKLATGANYNIACHVRKFLTITLLVTSMSFSASKSRAIETSSGALKL